MNLLLDTHVIIWSAAEPERLSAPVARRLNDPANTLWYSPISVWETLILVEKQRIAVGDGTGAAVRSMFEGLPLKEASMNLEVALQSRAVNLPHQDPGDRFLAATALVFELTLVTADKRMLTAPDLSLMDAAS